MFLLGNRKFYYSNIYTILVFQLVFQARLDSALDESGGEATPLTMSGSPPL